MYVYVCVELYVCRIMALAQLDCYWRYYSKVINQFIRHSMIMKNLLLAGVLSLVFIACVLGNKSTSLRSSSILRNLQKTQKTSQSCSDEDENTFIVAATSGISLFHFLSFFLVLIELNFTYFNLSGKN